MDRSFVQGPLANSRIALWLGRVATAMGMLVALVGAVHLTAWLSGHMVQRGFSSITMKTNASLCLTLSGLALAILAQARPGGIWRWAGQIFAAAATIVGTLTLSQHLIGWNLGIDQLLATEAPGAMAVTDPNRMGIPASACFTLAGLSLLILSRRDGRWRLRANLLALGVCLIALLGTIGYLYGVQGFYAVARYTGIAWPTAFALLMLGLGLLLARPTEGLMAQVTADDVGGANLRRWLPVLGLPILLGWLRLAGERQGVFDAPTGTAMMMMIFIVALAVLAYTGARPVSRSSAALNRQREWLRVTLTSIGDAVLATDTDSRITFLNPVAEAMTGWKEPDALGRPVQDVFRIINEHTRQPADDIVARVLREGRAVALANHTALLARDGREVPIEDSAAPIKDADGRTAGVVLVFHDVTQKRRAQEELALSEQRVRRKLDSLLSPEGDLAMLELADLIDVPATQTLMDDFYALSGFPMAMIDLQGKVLVGVGWQRICTQFHRTHPEICKHCVESDTELTTNVAPGEFRLYQCKNGLWDVATPVIVGGRHVGNLFTGQFFLDDQPADRDFFRSQARRYGLDEAAYLAALDAVPHMSRQMVNTCMAFLTKLAQSLSQLSFSNVKLARLLVERDKAQHETATASEFLKVINQSTSTRQLIAAAVRFFHQQSGCEAVGIRLKEGDDYPYYEEHGFPEEFVLMENSLCERDSDGCTRRDGAGNPCLACMCGNVICGRFDPAKPFFSANGSFWSNCTTELLSGTSEADRQASTRNRCNGQGYESVALIALRIGDNRMGLLQLNDKRKGMFTPESINLWERLTAYLCVALAKLQAEEALRESELFYRQTLESIPGMVFTTRPDGYCDFQSQQWVDFTGVPMEQHLGDGWNRLLHPDDRPRAFAAWQAAVEGRAPYDLEYRVRRHDGKYEWFKVLGRQIRDGDGQVVRWFGVAANIDAMKTAEEDLRRTAQEMARSNKELEQFAYISAHDLQEPLRQVRTFVQMLKDRHADKLDGKAAQYFQFVYDGAGRMSDLVRGLLEYSRIGGRGEPQSTSSQQALDAALANLQATIAQSRARLTHDDLPTVMVESTQLTQLFQNLIGNAVKFRRDGTTPTVHVGCRREGDRWLFWVKDNGIGIAPEYHEKVFLIFQRLHALDKYSGTGIGLAICKKIVEQHGGRIWIESQIDEGSTFYFTLPEAASE